jgi:hypothetical protein
VHAKVVKWRWGKSSPQKTKAFPITTKPNCTGFGRLHDTGSLCDYNDETGRANNLVSRAQAVLQKRQVVLQAAYQKTPQRFVKGLPLSPQLPQAVWINPPNVTLKSD